MSYKNENQIIHVDVKNIGAGKIIPSDKELETVVIGCLLMEPIKLSEVSVILKSDDFYLEANQIMYAGMVEMDKVGKSIDFMSLTEFLKTKGLLEQAGGYYGVTRTTQSVVSAVHVLEHTLIIKQKSIARQLIKKAYTLAFEAFEDSTDALELLDKTVIEMQQLQIGLSVSKTTTIYDAAKETLHKMIESRQIYQNNSSAMLGLPTSIKRLDSAYEGFNAPDFLIIAAGPGEGKTTFALQAAIEVARNTDEGVAFFSLEMKNNQLLWKVFSAIIKKPITEIRKGLLQDDEFKKLYEDVAGWVKKKFFMFDLGGQSVYDVISNIRRVHAKHGIKIVYIDYLQLLNARGAPQQVGNREQEISAITKALKALCMELNITIVALSQVSRIQKGVKRMYNLGDLRESGAIEQDADGVIFIFRPHKHGIVEMEVDGKPKVYSVDDALLIVEKWRLGTTGIIPIKFDGANNRFYELESTNNLFTPVQMPQQTPSPSNNSIYDETPF